MNVHSSNGILITCDAVMKQYILKLQEDTNSAASDGKAQKMNPAKKRAIVKLEEAEAAAALNEAALGNAAAAGGGVDLADTSFLRSVTFIELDDTHLFATGAPSDIQERLQKQVDILHEQHTCKQTVSYCHYNNIRNFFVILKIRY